MSIIDFSKVEAPKSVTYLTPGIYKLSPSEVKLEEPKDKSAYLNVTFSGAEGSVRQKFYLTPKAFDNLQYLHIGLFEKPLTKAFDSNVQIHAYFEKALLSKKIEKTFLVGAQQADNGKLYSELPYGKFLIKETTPHVLGAFEEGTARWDDVVRQSKLTGGRQGSIDLSSNSAVLPDASPIDDSIDTTDMPW